jgi:hypothetical protein
MKYKKGVIIGFIVGVLSVPLSLLGLGSAFGMIFYPLIILPKLATAGYQSIPVLVVASIAIYSLLGFFVQWAYHKFRGVKK